MITNKSAKTGQRERSIYLRVSKSQQELGIQSEPMGQMGISAYLWNESCHMWFHFIQLGKNISSCDCILSAFPKHPIFISPLF